MAPRLRPTATPASLKWAPTNAPPPMARPLSTVNFSCSSARPTPISTALMIEKKQSRKPAGQSRIRTGIAPSHFDPSISCTARSATRARPANTGASPIVTPRRTRDAMAMMAARSSPSLATAVNTAK